MSRLLLSRSEQGIVVFHVWKSLGYKTRMLLSLLLIIAGFVIQYYMLNLLPGIILVLAGNLLLLVKGYDNRIKLDSYSPDNEWIKTDEKQLSVIESMNNKIKRWDVSGMDITSNRGCLLFFIILALLFILVVLHPYSFDTMLIIAVNAAVLILPHWFTGLRRISTTPVLLTKIKLYKKLLSQTQEELKEGSVNFLMLVNEKNKFPTDIKMKVNFRDQPEELLGVYAQIATNNVQGTLYPYFYVVLVAKEKSKLLSKNFDEIKIPKNLIKEFKPEKDIEIIVIRQYTTKTSGYHTNDKAVINIFITGLDAVRTILKK